MALDEYFNARELASFAENRLSGRGRMLWETLFPSQSFPSLNISWIKARNNQIKLLRPAAFGEKAARRSPVGFTTIKSELPFFRESMVVDERQRQEISNTLILYADNPDVQDEILQNLYEEHAQLVWGAYANCDLMVGSLLTSAKIQFDTDVNDGRTNNYLYDYDEDSSWHDNNVLTLTGTHQWNSANKSTNDPMEDILQAIENQRLKGWNTANVLMNTNTFRGFYQSESIYKTISPLGGIVRRSQARDLLQDEAQVNLVIYDNLVKMADGTTQNVLPDGYVCLLPQGELGRMCFAATPEAYNLQLNKTQPRKDIAVMRNGVTILTKAEDNPVDYQTIVSMIALPSYPMMDAVYVINTLGGAGE